MARTPKTPRLRTDRRGMSPVRVGIIATVVVVLITYFGFTKAIPFDHGYRLNAVFQTANSIRPNSPVRIAGVNVGLVTDVVRQPGTNAAIVKMEIDDAALPIHKDAELKIRPRIFLEGNFFVDLHPGSPAAPSLSDDDTVPITQTATPVQLDQVLTALQRPTREDLQTLLQNLGGSLTDKPTTLQDLQQDPSVRGKTAAEALNQALRYSPAALRDSSIVNQALLGTTPKDLPRLIASLGTVSGALNSNENQLKDLLTNFNTTLGVFASQSSNLTAAVGLLGPTLTNANKALVSLNNSFPATRTFALELIPGTEQTQPTIDAALPWIAQVKPLVSTSELGGLLNNLQPTTASLASLTYTSTGLAQQGELLSKCQTKVFLPAGDVKIKDSAFSTGAENYKEFWYSMVGLAAEGQGFDGNGQYVRFQPGGGVYPVKTPPFGTGPNPQIEQGNAIAPSLGSLPAFQGVTNEPPKVGTKPCYKQALPQVNGADGQGLKPGPKEDGTPGTAPTTLNGIYGGVPAAATPNGPQFKPPNSAVLPNPDNRPSVVAP